MNNYETFHHLHHRDKPLVIANAWNVKSALVIEQNGVEAVATSSGAIANSLGYKDGENISFKELLYIVQRITGSVNIPVSVDLERGYADDINKLTDNIQDLIDAGVAGINIEDSQGEESYLTKLYAIKNFLERTNQKLFINARTDGFLQKLDSPLELTLKRAKLYKDAGVDSLFVSGISDIETIKIIASSIALPLNIVGSSKLSSIQALAECGVKRISMAVFLYNAAYNHLEKLVQELIAEQSFASLF